ncbi:regulatory protein YlbF [Pullulanibacillus camelliae]|uniref:Regulatory protein YlbF n=1 Tax=Pullulanibacillus camelliae TaxID=1707096 RepID=A0A8J2W2T2_9BACL|nr:YlbF family regulator [Pullulanibacillus camelliae]GGE41131.1 regulatory protein YlbF [Pullulanibacillus camelliae]
MIATMEHIKLLDQADGIVDMLADSEAMEHYRQCKRQLAQDKEALALINRFTKLRERYDEVQRFGKYHPDYKTVITAMMEIKRELDLNDTIVAYKKAEDDFEKLLNAISQSLAQAVSPSIKVPTGDPFFDRGCGGGCGSGGACSCH